MGVSVDWHDPRKTIIRYTFAGKWTWDEFYQGWNWALGALDASEQPVCVIMDLSGTRYLPADALVHFKSIMQQVHPKYGGALACVGEGLAALGALYLSLMRALNPGLVDQYRVFFKDTLEEAAQVLDDWSAAQAKGSST